MRFTASEIRKTRVSFITMTLKYISSSSFFEILFYSKSWGKKMPGQTDDKLSLK